MRTLRDIAWKPRVTRSQMQNAVAVLREFQQRELPKLVAKAAK